MCDINSRTCAVFARKLPYVLCDLEGHALRSPWRMYLEKCI